LALCVGLAAAACGSDSGGGSSASAASTASGTSKTSTTSSTAKASTPSSGSATVAAAPPPASGSPSGSADAGGDAPKEASIDEIAGGKDEDASGVLAPDLEALQSPGAAKAPSLGAKTEPPPPKEGKLEWLPAGPLLVPNPGWTLTKLPDGALLEPPDKKHVAVLFKAFTTKEDGAKKVDDVVAKLKLKDIKWKKPKLVRLGKDNIPALVGFGKNAEVKLFYAMVGTGGKENLLAIGGGEEKAGKEALETTINIVLNIKKK
jgi:hypothetical protein